MARYTGPKHRLARREGENILDKTSNSLQRRLNTPPGVHGKKQKRRLSEYGLQLREKAVKAKEAEATKQAQAKQKQSAFNADMSALYESNPNANLS